MKYFLLWGNVVGKEEKGEYFIFRDGKWVADRSCLIRDRLIGYDPSEPPDSPYCIGNGLIMEEMVEITYRRALELTGGCT